MGITKKFDRAFQWAGERMGHEAKTTMSDDFKMLETEMALRFDGMERLQKSMSAYVKWLGRRGETFEDREKGLPVAYLGRTMTSHGEDFEPDSEFGNCLITMGRANERAAAIQETFVADATTTWLESIERSLAMMKEFQASRKKLESRRLAYDACTTKMQKAKRDDFRLEEELRSAKAKYEEASEDVFRRMQDIKDAEADSVRDMTHFLEAELDYHERCAEELRQVRQNWAETTGRGGCGGGGDRYSDRARSNTASSYEKRTQRTRASVCEQDDQHEPEPQPVRMPIHSISSRSVADAPPRPGAVRHNTFQGGASLERANTARLSTGNTASAASTYAVSPLNVSQLRGQLRPVGRLSTGNNDVFGDHEHDDDTASGSGSPDWGERSASPATSFGSLGRSTSNVAANGTSTGGNNVGLGLRKTAPPPPPPNRSKKPAPPVPAKRVMQ